MNDLLTSYECWGEAFGQTSARTHHTWMASPLCESAHGQLVEALLWKFSDKTDTDILCLLYVSSCDSWAFVWS